MIGYDRFVRYVAPCYNRLAERLHSKGKRLGSHLDGNLKPLKEAVGETALDFIEAYNPPPDGDLSIREARRCWGSKVIAINFTSSIHLTSPEAIAGHTRQLLEDAAPGTGFVVGITENIPDHVWQKSLPVVLKTLRNWGPVPR